MEKFGIKWIKHKAKENTLFLVEDKKSYNRSNYWFLLVQDSNNVTQYLAFHKTNKIKNNILNHINTSRYSVKQKLYEAPSIKLNLGAKYKDYNSIFSSYNLYAIPLEYIHIIKIIDPKMTPYIAKFTSTPQMPHKYWTYRAGENARLWDECSKKNIISIGWDYLGNLKQYSSKEEISEKISNEEHKKNPMNDVLACWEFANEMNINDIIYVEKGRDCLVARGIVESDYIYDNTRQKYRNIRKVRWTHKEEHKLDFKLDVKTLTDISPSKFGNYCKKIEDIFMNNKKNTENIPLNQILYGPPGTGKTYNTVIKAMEIINETKYDSIDDEKYKDLKKQFDKLKKQGQIEFVTFHQSYSYEEFVEGIKPDLENEKELKYKLQNGTFKTICKAAERELYLSNEDKKVSFETIYKMFQEKYEPGSNFSNLLNIKYEQNNLIYHYGTQSKDRRIDLNKIRTIFNANQQYETASDFNKDYQGNIALKGYCFNFYKELLQIKNDYIDEKKIDNNINQNALKYILIIDEINRGNISKIFGELITLIETDKRIGNKYQATTTLPYSKEQLGVPNNLYIIGTMNTSDRSIASIDIALRRRFKFVEMMPKPEVIVDKNNQPQMVEDINLQGLLKTINERISYLLDRDHQIGHSYFMNWEKYDMATLKNVWFDEIMPLLNEYFYSDWDKLQAILGAAKEIGSEKSFIVKIKKPDLPYEADCSDEEVYYNFVKIEDTDKDTDFRTMLENAKLIEPKSNEINETNEQTEAN